MKEKQNKKAAVSRDLIVGVAVSLGLTLTARVLNVIYTEISSSPSVLVDILDAVVFVFDSVIYAAGAALIINFIRREEKRGVGLSFLFVLLILAFDYAVSFIIDLFSDNIIGGLEIATAVYLFLNFAARALTYLLIFWLAPAIMKSSPSEDDRIPVFSLKYPVGRLMFFAALFHMVPYLLFEIYSNITGIVEFGFPTAAADIVSIISAYGEIILIDGAVTYFSIYLILSVLSLVRKTPKTET